jgi:hypothetical protein
MAAARKSFEVRIADLVRKLGTDFEQEALVAWGALKRLLASQSASFTDLGDAIEKLATGGLADDQMQRVYDAGRAQGHAGAERKHAEAQAAYGLRPDGSPYWERIALCCQREKGRLKEDRHRQFVDDMAARMVWGHQPTEKQGKYLLSLFRQLGGRING